MLVLEYCTSPPSPGADNGRSRLQCAGGGSSSSGGGSSSSPPFAAARAALCRRRRELPSDPAKCMASWRTPLSALLSTTFRPLAARAWTVISL